ncbi:hypothetical protein LPJ53_005720 [Coemansia erecta]|uniref:RING-type domain-containing protein n=1 Tax=Coemansia erecta TaxID=147472 RepID=A0A9W7XW54_9FUNG|nr:hypothetical protein LPJ53_005720 [Coemansia erecta]
MVCTICYDSLFKQPVKNNNNNNNNRRRNTGQGHRPAALSCGHTFHKGCINRWVSSSSSYNCPICGVFAETDPTVLFIELGEEDAKHIVSDNANAGNSSNSSSSSSSNNGGRSKPADIDDLVEHITRMSLREKRESEKREADIESKLKAVEEELRSIKTQLNDSQNSANWYKGEVTRLERLSERHVDNINGLHRALHNKKCDLEELEDEFDEFKRSYGHYY